MTAFAGFGFSTERDRALSPSSWWPGGMLSRVRIMLRADAGFAREELMHWCELNGVDYLFGLAKNERLTAAIAAELDAARQHSAQTGRPARRFKDFTWATLDSWSRSRRVVAKAEWTGGAANPRFVVASLARADHEARHLYEVVYCARGDMENRIKERQLDLFADRISATTMRANQLRLWFAAMAYVSGFTGKLGLPHHEFPRFYRTARPAIGGLRCFWGSAPEGLSIGQRRTNRLPLKHKLLSDRVSLLLMLLALYGKLDVPAMWWNTTDSGSAIPVQHGNWRIAALTLNRAQSGGFPGRE